MWNILIFTAFLGTVACDTFKSELFDSSQPTTLHSLTESEQKLQTLSTEIPVKDSSTEIVPLAVPTQPPQITSTKKPTIALENDDETSVLLPLKNRIVTYDQRQEGQYNIRADLENFMIVLIPPNPAEGVNLLDLLTRSSSRRNSYSSKGKLKHKTNDGRIYGSHSSPSSGTKYQQTAETGNNNQNFNYLSGGREQSSFPVGRFRGDSHQPYSIVEKSAAQISDFIEGRTPYHVDISSNDGEQSLFQPDRQVDVLPPLPLSYQHLTKPFHLEAEPTVIQILPPSNSIASKSAIYQDTYNHLPSSGSIGGVFSNIDDGYRVNKALYYGSNNAEGLPLYPNYDIQSLSPFIHDNIVGRTKNRLPIYSDVGKIYPDIDVPRLSKIFQLAANSKTLDLPLDSDDSYAEPKFDNSEKILQIDDNDDNSKWQLRTSLHSELTPQCGYQQRRDSYGNCRFLDDY